MDRDKLEFHIREMEVSPFRDGLEELLQENADLHRKLADAEELSEKRRAALVDTVTLCERIQAQCDSLY